MNATRMMYVVAVVALASPAVAADAATKKDARRDDVAARATTHPCPATLDRDGKLRCACAAKHGAARPEPTRAATFTDAG